MKPTLLKLATFLLMVAVAFAFASCEKPVEPTKPKPPQPKYPIDVPFTEYSLDGTNCEWQNLPYDDKVIIINSKEEFEQYITCPVGSYRNIDFSKSTLLLASGKTTNIILKTNGNLQKFSDDEYHLVMGIIIDNHITNDKWLKVLLVEKLNEGTITKFESTIVKPELIYPITVTDPNIIDFFNMAFPTSDGHFFDESPCFFNTIPLFTDTCLIINSMGEFKHASRCTKDLPEIDFDKYTLIIGKETMMKLSDFMLGHKILEDRDLVLFLEKGVRTAGLAALHRVYYWGLYHKLPNKTFFVKRIWIDID